MGKLKTVEHIHLLAGDSFTLTIPHKDGLVPINTLGNAYVIHLYGATVLRLGTEICPDRKAHWPKPSWLERLRRALF